MKHEREVGTVKDERSGAECRVTLIYNYVETEHGSLHSDPTVRISGTRRLHFDMPASSFVDGSRALRLPSNWFPDEPDDYAISEQDHARLAERVREMVPPSIGEFKVAWVPSDPRIPF
jgi:hypothetical protein